MGAAPPWKHSPAQVSPQRWGDGERGGLGQCLFCWLSFPGPGDVGRRWADPSQAPPQSGVRSSVPSRYASLQAPPIPATPGWGAGLEFCGPSLGTQLADSGSASPPPTQTGSGCHCTPSPDLSVCVCVCVELRPEGLLRCPKETAGFRRAQFTNAKVCACFLPGSWGGPGSDCAKK